MDGRTLRTGACGLGRRVRCGMVILSIVGLMACSRPPAGVDSGAELPAPPPDSRSGDAAPEAAYDVEQEGEFPQAADVNFEEDQLPPRPEDVEGAVLDEARVEEENVAPIEPSLQTPVEPSVKSPVPQTERLELRRGWRVQLLAAGERVEAERIASQARQRLGTNVYVVFEAPFYKVRAGDFVDRSLAQQLRDRAKANGYSEAWVVATEVRSPAAGGKP